MLVQMRIVVLGLLVLAACSSSEIATVTSQGGDASTEPDASPVDPVVEQEDSAAPEQDAGTEADATPEAEVDAGQDVTDPPPPVDAASDVVIVPPQDAAPDSPPTGAACVDNIKAPESATWTIFVRYEGGVSQPYACPSTVEGNSCKFALIAKGAQEETNGDYVWRTPPCRVDVPAKCLPCTGTVTVW